MHTKVFNIVAAAQRPLTLAELREAISVEPGETPWDSTKAANDMFKLIQCCGSLLVVDEEDLTAHFAHYSVLQYLCSENVDRTLNAYHIHPVGASSLLGEICVTYLNYEHLDTQLVKASENPRPQLITPSIVLRESLALKNIVIKLAVKYLTSRRNVGHDISPLLEKAVAVNPELEKKTAQEHLFLYYAREFWLFHIKSCSSLNGGKVKPLWRRLIAGKLRTVQLPWAPENFSDFSPEFMEWVIEHQYWALLSEAIEQTGQTSDIFEQRVLRRLSPKELETDTVQVLPKEVLIATLNRYGLMAVGQICLMNKTYAEVLGGIELQQASTRGELATIRLLIERGADVNTKDSKNGFSQLHLAFTQGKPAVVKLLLENGADIHAECGTFGSALQAASIQGHEEIVMLLVGKGADVNAKGGTYGNALQGACCGTGDEEIVKLLLKGGADVNAIGGLYGTALHAVSHHHVEDEGIMELLLENGADVNAQAGSWGTALHVLASLYDRESMVRRLLHYGADVNINCGRYGTALQAASFNGHQATVKILLEKGADVNAEGGRTGSALQAARVYEHKAIEKLLLEHGTIDPDKPNMKMMKYLQRQSTRGLGSGAASVDMEGAKFNAEDGPSSQNSWP
jgi:ankyrin repeat protein